MSQKTLNDFVSTEVIEQNEEEQTDEGEYFDARRRQQLRAAGVDIAAARRVKEVEQGAGSWWPPAADEAERHYVEVRNKAHLYVPASDMQNLSWGGIQ